MVFSVKLSNANPVSAWIGERLTLPGVVDFSCILFSCSVPVLFFFFFFFDILFLILLSLSNYSICICSADVFSNPETCLG